MVLVVIKYSPHLTKYEAENQQKAYELVDFSILRIPRVYRYSRDEGVGYIMMEFVKGKTIDPLEDPGLIDRVVKVLNHFSTILGQKPRNLAGGPCAGILGACLQECDLVLCHLDIAPSHIIWQDDGTICIVDWESAEGKDGNFNSLLLNGMTPLPSHELAQKDRVCRLWYNTQKYAL
ncbi:kinase-like domain-containing protein [Penicillium malachiteum]|uniref:kinase-like domain-containing protein n=1 Tax=Penicillium malachiteum TaxID=1324776 RepID=UPI0025497E57|nr:kinase-like domain-containing protein [Penicillium malachiteum]KAJ5715280.1 kinase-like domain-containing protein [Penicillium malachiteum]